jgi:asparagine synthase (glutamine-hydrolysing)
MPGLTFYCNLTEISNLHNGEIKKSISKLLFSDRYRVQELLHSNNYSLFVTKYSEYPFSQYSNKRYEIFVEGMIYNKRSEIINSQLTEVADSFENNLNKLNNWIENTDGEFIVIIYDKIKNVISIFNDSLGRLPLYKYINGDKIIISREISFFFNLPIDIYPNKLALSEFLHIGYSLGEDTLFGNIKRVSPARMISINLNTFKPSEQIILEHNFDEKVNHSLTLKQAVINLEEKFLESCANRMRIGYENIISLSGGLDSRSILAAFDKLKLDFSAATFITDDAYNKYDTTIAEEIASSVGCKHKKFQLAANRNQDIEFLIWSKYGLNQIGLAYLLQFYQNVISYFGANVSLFSGDGGDKVLPHLYINKGIKSIDQLVEYIIASRQELFDIDTALKITNVSKSDFKLALYEIFENYPEESIAGKFTHFLIFERGFKWLFEGEDRVRYWIWNMAPFYSLPFFNFAMSVPNSFKKNHLLYRNFLLKLSSKIAHIKDARWRVPITSKKIFFFNLFKEKIYPSFPPIVKRKIHNKLIKINVKEDYVDFLMDFLDEKELSIKKPFWISTSELKKKDTFNTIQIDHILTLLYLEERFNARRV